MNNNQKFLIIIAGPTAVGKSELSIHLAQRLNAEIISADSRQIFKEMTIGTAKVSKEEMALVPHHFIDIKHISENYSAGQYETDVINFLQDYYKKNSIAILTGGTGLYIKAVMEGLDEFPDVPSKIVEQLEIDLNEKGLKNLQEELQQKDPQFYKDADTKNPRRVLRALSIISHTNVAFTDYQTLSKKTRAFKSIPIVLHLSREILYKKINARVDHMMEEGLLKEVKELMPYRKLKALNTVGYQELFDHLEGRISLDEAIEKIKQHSRNYAKRQITWFNNSYQGKQFSPTDTTSIIDYVLKEINP